MNEELALIEELRDTIPATQDMAHTMQGDRQERAADTIERLIRERDGLHEQLQFLASECDALKRQRDEARAERQAIGAMKDMHIGMLHEAEARGFERGVKEAVEAGDKMAEKGTYGWVWLRAAILALLEPKLSDPTHNEGISETAHTLQKPEA
jgi:uncharacterized coiled-coil DUF342 family protein